MAVTIRLMRFGKRHYPTYRIVALDKRRKRDGSYIEKIGTYNPMVEPMALEINEERMSYWTKNGALISEGMRKLLKKSKSQAAKAEPAKAPAKEAAPAKEVKAKAPAKKAKKTA
jgi:small subunit ribosomal protein S16